MAAQKTQQPKELSNILKKNGADRDDMGVIFVIGPL